MVIEVGTIGVYIVVRSGDQETYKESKITCVAHVSILWFNNTSCEFPALC